MAQFTDVIQHLPSRKQTVTWPSSVDPWHAATDLDESKGDQVGFDFFFSSGVTRGLPTMVPIAMLYSTPDEAAAEIAYLYKRHYPISWIEMGEEADGQHMLPGGLWRAVPAIRQRRFIGWSPKPNWAVRLLKASTKTSRSGRIREGRVSWLGRFLDYLKAHGRMSDFTFFSFEHYPFNACKNPWSDLYREPGHRRSHSAGLER